MTTSVPDPIDELEDLLMAAEMPDDAMLLGAVDGLIAAALIVPGLLTDDAWLSAIWAGGPSPFGDAARTVRLRELVMARKAAVVGELLEGDLAYAPVYELDTDETPLWQIWIEGFAVGVALREEAWRAQLASSDDDLGAAALGLAMPMELADDYRSNHQLAEQAPDLIPYFVETLYRRQRGLPRIVLDPSVGEADWR